MSTPLVVTVLGSAGSHTGPGLVCSGYLLSCGDVRVLIDCGNGSTANLQRSVRFEDLDAIVVTHRHVDHCIDLVGMYYALRFHDDGPQSVPLYAGNDVIDMLTGLLDGDSKMHFLEVFQHHTITAGERFEVGPLQFETFDSVHPVPTLSLRVAVDGRTLAYSSDSAGGPQLAACARDVDLLLCEATWQGDASKLPPDIHLTARQAGQVATDAGARRLLLTHLLGSIDRDRSLVEARETFDGDVELAVENRSYQI